MGRRKHTDEWKTRQAGVARGLTGAQRRGMTFQTSTTRTVVVTFPDDESAEAWDRLDDEQAFYAMWEMAAKAKAKRERRQTARRLATADKEWT